MRNEMHGRSLDVSGGRPRHLAVQPDAMLRRFCKDRSGVTAVEFSLVALPFFALVFIIIEVSISYVAQQVLSTAIEDLARQFYTGEILAGTPAAQATSIRTTICGRIQFMVAADCPGLSINLGNYVNFTQVPTDLLAADGKLNVPEQINLGGPSTINQLNVLYRWPVMTDILRLMTLNKETKGILPLFTTITWQNEPF